MAKALAHRWIFDLAHNVKLTALRIERETAIRAVALKELCSHGIADQFLNGVPHRSRA